MAIILEKDNLITIVYRAILFRHVTQKVFQINTFDPPKHIVITETEAKKLIEAIEKELKQ